MSRDEALDTLVRHSEFFHIYAKELSIPTRGLEGIIGEILAAYKVINTGYICQSCNHEWIIDANRYRLHRMKELEELKLKHYTFPKHD